jgi:lysyl-tRNA synthetase class 2
MSEDEYRRLIRLKANLCRRALIYEFTRAFFRERGFFEVETPIRVPSVAPELHIVPVESEDWVLSTSPELYMKRMLAAGYDRLFQISRCFRKHERGRWHNPEFAMLEWYRIGADYMDTIHDTEQLVTTLADKLGLGTTVRYGNRDIDLTLPWQRMTVRGAFLHTAGWDPITEPDAARFDLDLVTKIIPSLSAGRPIVLLDYPASMASLARLKPNDTRVGERAEVFIAGLEIANAYSELTDYQEQEKRFREEIEHIQQEPGRKATMPQQFLEAVARLPTCGGIALGMDRLVMLLCNAASIDEVVAFTVDTA